jgi:hypothetical protein
LRSLALFCARPCPGFVPVDFPGPGRGRGTKELRQVVTGALT